MQVKTSNAMAKLLDKKLKKIKCIDYIYLTKITDMAYGWICSIYSDCNLDYDYKTGKYNIIIVKYKDNCYAPNRYLTTSDLIHCYKLSNGTLEDFLKEVKNEIEI